MYQRCWEPCRVVRRYLPWISLPVTHLDLLPQTPTVCLEDCHHGWALTLVGQSSLYSPVWLASVGVLLLELVLELVVVLSVFEE